MSIIKTIFGQKSDQTLPKIKTISAITDLTPTQKSEIEELTNSGAKAGDVAEALNIPVNIVYSYRKNVMKAGSTAGAEMLADKLRERDALKIENEILLLKAEAEQRNMQIQLKNAEILAQIKELKDSLKGEDGNGSLMEQFTPIIIELFQTLRANKQNKNPQTHQEVNNNPSGLGELPAPSGADSPPIQEEEQEPETHDLTDEQIKQILKTIDKKYISLAKILPREVVFSYLYEHYPAISETSINRAIEMLNE